MTENVNKTNIYYDGNCKVCDAEIGLYKKADRDTCQFSFVDISSDDFNADDHKLDEESVHREFTIKNADGNVVSGVDAFIAIWEKIPSWRWAAKVAKFAPVHLLMRGGYQVFVVVRPYLPKKDPSKNRSSK